VLSSLSLFKGSKFNSPPALEKMYLNKKKKKKKKKKKIKIFKNFKFNKKKNKNF